MAYKVEIDAEKSPFSRRVNQVLSLIMEGRNREAVALALHIGINTVNTHMQAAFNVAGVDNLASLMTYLYAEGIAKAKKTLVLCLMVSGVGNALIPDKAYAESDAKSPFEVPEKRPMMRGRHGLRVRINRSGRPWGRKQIQLWLDCFGDF